jgi:hypothetical protein
MPFCRFEHTLEFALAMELTIGELTLVPRTTREHEHAKAVPML